MKPKIVVDPGSCHLGSYDRCLELIKCAEDAGVSAIKWQALGAMFKGSNGNIELPFEWFPKLAAATKLETYASVWGMNGLQLVKDCDCKSIKFAYSQRHSYLIPKALEMFPDVYVSCDVTDVEPTGVKRLWVAHDSQGALYPYQFSANWAGLFDYPTDSATYNLQKFYGASIHSLDINEPIRAAQNGAPVIEIHMCIGDSEDLNCPDGRFAYNPTQVKYIVDKIIDKI